MTPVIKDGRTVIPDKAIASISKHFIALKGPLATPIGKGAVSLNVRSMLLVHRHILTDMQRIS